MAEAKARTVILLVPLWIKSRAVYEITLGVLASARQNTRVPYRLLVAEKQGATAEGPVHGGSTGHDGYWFTDHREPDYDPGRMMYVRCPGRSFSGDCNFALDESTKVWPVGPDDLFVLGTNDDYYDRFWADALLQCFDLPDCVAATLDHNDRPECKSGCAYEGSGYGAMLTVGRHLRLDARDFPFEFSDLDLFMRAVTERPGGKHYRTHNSRAVHFGPLTATNDLARRAAFPMWRERFVERWQEHLRKPQFAELCAALNLVWVDGACPA